MDNIIQVMSDYKLGQLIVKNAQNALDHAKNHQEARKHRLADIVATELNLTLLDVCDGVTVFYVLTPTLEYMQVEQCCSEWKDSDLHLSIDFDDVPGTLWFSPDEYDEDPFQAMIKYLKAHKEAPGVQAILDATAVGELL